MLHGSHFSSPFQSSPSLVVLSDDIAIAAAVTAVAAAATQGNVYMTRWYEHQADRSSSSIVKLGIPPDHHQEKKGGSERESKKRDKKQM